MHVYCTYFYYSHSMVKSSLQFVPVCRSLFQFVPFVFSLKKCRESMGSNLGHGSQGGVGQFRGSHGVVLFRARFRGSAAIFRQRIFFALILDNDVASSGKI